MSRSLVLLVLRDTVRRPPFRPPVSPRMSSESMVEASRALVAVLGRDLCRADFFLHFERVLLVLGPAGVGVLRGGLTRVSDLVHLADALPEPAAEDRKSTRLNSSHLVISYAVFCLKKK